MSKTATPAPVAPESRAESRHLAAGDRTRPLRVMHLLLKLGFGGAESGVVKLANGFDRSSIEPSICSCWPADPIKNLLRPDVALFEMNRRRRGNDISFIVKLYQLLRRVRPDVLHTHGWATLCEGVFAARLASVPVIVHGEHGTLETRRRNLLLQRFIWGRLDRVLSVSTRLTDRLAQTVGFPTERIETIRNGVDSNRFTPQRRAAARSAFGFGDIDLVVGAVGRLLPVKDHYNLINALAALNGQGIRFTAFVVGEGPLRDSLTEQTQRLGLGGAVRFLGERSDVEDVLASFDIFVSSSRSEGLSNTVLEAMATGLPAVATDVGGTDELVLHGITGLLVPANDSTALASAIRSLALDGDGRRRMGWAARRRVEAEFDLPGMIRRYEELYLRLARA